MWKQLLFGEIDEEIFMKSPVGMEEIDPGSSSEDLYQLVKGIYGLCQAARQFWKSLWIQQKRNLLESRSALQRRSLGCALL